MHPIRIAIASVTALALAACSAGTSALTAPCGLGAPCAARRSVSSVVLGPFPATLVVGDTATLLAAAVDSVGQIIVGTTLTFSSTTPVVAAVDSTGLVTALQPGGTYIVAEAGAKRDSVALAVTGVTLAIRGRHER